MIDIDNSTRDITDSPPSKLNSKFTLKEGTEANRLYEKLKKGTLDLLIPDHFDVPRISKKIKQALPDKKNIMMSFQHRKPCLDLQTKIVGNEDFTDATPDILTMNKMKVPVGYVPIKAVLRYQVTTDNEKAIQINFKVGNTSKTIKPFIEGKKITTNSNKNCTVFRGELEISLGHFTIESEPTIACMNENNEIPFSIFIRESKQHSLDILIGCELQKSTSNNWPLKTYNRLKERYNQQQEDYEIKFREQQQLNEHSLFDMI
ncbi:hypothetical protein [uncultured Formosa sp.]|uniref:hypothetical protein n=1 Tax=uncultured Formosa sp. TaxID=255435 RepID=UPI00260E937C|nr:hypothetical protein [uncultured Formosa sp.]